MSARGQELLRQLDDLALDGRHADVVALAGKAVEAGSKRLQVHFRLAAACLKTSRYQQAAQVIQAAASLAPAEPAELVELAQRMLYFNLSGDLRDVATRLVGRPAWHAGAEADFAALLSMAGEQGLAARLLDRSVAMAGATPAVLYNRSQIHLYSGRLAEAASDLRQALRLQPAMAKAYWALSKLPSSSREGAADADSAGQLLARVRPGSQDEVFLRFALFNLHHRDGRTTAAWQALERGCAVKRTLLRYDAGASAALFDALCKLPALAPGLSGKGDRNAAGPSAFTPIFIVGMHRSGTTLLERILGSHSRVAEAGELYDFPAQLRLAVGRHFSGASDIAVAQACDALDFDAIGAGYLDGVRWRTGGLPYVIDKLPSNFLNIGYLRRALPQARIIHMQREPMDGCFSNLKELFSNACPYSYDQAELADYYAGYRRLMAHWRETLPGFVLDVQYEALARDPETEARRILAFCGLPWEPHCLDIGANRQSVNTASSAQVREPIHQRGIGAWHRYGDWLGPMAERLAGHGIG